MEEDALDKLIGQWLAETPELDLQGMHVVGRIIWLGRHLEDRIETNLKPWGVSYTDFDILATLRRLGEPYSASLAVASRMTRRRIFSGLPLAFPTP
ncbi:hypothetical protein CD351_08345 [Erythrobacter sp. KY5]|nr:hypothetical protein CD351_08345 [Erythrobacter sp. KY5]